MIKFVICGIEHSGTTLVSDLFRQLPHVDAGFEVGVLLARSPRAFPELQPFAQNLLGGWKISREALLECCDTDSFAEFYERLQASSGSLAAGTQDIFDKTPRYLANLKQCMAQAQVPCIVMHKDPRAIVCSDFQRSKQGDFDRWFETYAPSKLTYMRHLYANHQAADVGGGRILRMSLESLCMTPRTSCEAMFNHCGYEFSPRYFLLKGLRFAHTRSDSISARIPFEYLDVLTKDQQATVRSRFEEFTGWFYD